MRRASFSVPTRCRAGLVAHFGKDAFGWFSRPGLGTISRLHADSSWGALLQVRPRRAAVRFGGRLWSRRCGGKTSDARRVGGQVPTSGRGAEWEAYGFVRVRWGDNRASECWGAERVARTFRFLEPPGNGGDQQREIEPGPQHESVSGARSHAHDQHGNKAGPGSQAAPAPRLRQAEGGKGWM